MPEIFSEKKQGWMPCELEFLPWINMSMKELSPLTNDTISRIRIVEGPEHLH
ncbi:hypothetical protein FACI_IFERC00001G0514 [Ferroplasma acidarmanus Fer1]|uniref:Uncharacterized protein n=1 Tax=Ferroplasma acidarmanus Fer1 TaxID=333146 RepID=S0AQP6_FERAC|nr:hypothetical protein FACI_IFERC00001G0514 [Ferroplasma acidarmanus Fer1]